MCGICGEFTVHPKQILNSQSGVSSSSGISSSGISDSNEPSLTLKKMNSILQNRGPDDEGYFVQGPMQMAHRRLSIIDLSALAHQPMHDPNLGLTLVFNGTIYNYIELRNELQQKGYQFQSSGDTEVLLKAFHCWGKECVLHLNGIFSFAVWNKHTQELFLARDRFGIKPLYYADGPIFRFASTLPAILATKDVDTTFDKEALQFYFHLHAVVPAPRTIFRGIRKLGPAQMMTIQKDGTLQIETYWKLKAQRPRNDQNQIIEYSEQEWTQKLKTSLWTAVKRQQLASDVPVGIFLSGGLDSSLLVGIFHELGIQNINTFSIGFEEFNGVKADEFEFSDAIVNKYKTKHHKYLVPYIEMLQQIPHAVKFMSEPMVSTDVTAFDLLSQRASQEIKVVHCGQGADEVLGGYFWYPRMQAEQGLPLHRFGKHYLDRSQTEYLNLINCDYHPQRDEVRTFIQAELSSAGSDSFMDSVFKLDVSTLIVDDPVKRIDNMTMAWGLEARVPFLDLDFVELCLQTPPEFKLKSEGKYPLKMMSRGIVPDAVIDRPKGYFPVPVLRFVKGPYYDFMCDILNSKACIDRGLFQRSYVENLMKNPQSDFTPIQGNKLWHLALFELWLQTHL